MDRWIFGLGPVLGEARRARFEGSLASLLGRPVELRPSLTYTELLDAVATRAVHLAWMGPAVYVRARAIGTATGIATVERHGQHSYRGALFVRADTPIHEPRDLEGARIAWVDPSSCAGYLFPRLALAKTGLDLDRLGTERFAGSYRAVVRAVEGRAVEAGAGFVAFADPSRTSSQIRSAAWSDSPDLEARVILVTPEVPADVVVATPRLSAADVADATAALLRMHLSAEGQETLAGVFNATALATFEEDAYAPVREALYAAGERL